MGTEKLLTVDDAAKALLVKPTTVREWLKAGKLGGVKMGHLWRVRESDLETFLKESASNMDRAEKARENRLRRQAARQGYGIRKDRHQPSRDVDHMGGYMVYALFNNAVEFGARYDATLDDIEAFLKKDA